MKVSRIKYFVFGIAGVIAWGLQISAKGPSSWTSHWIPWWLTFPAMGVPFALLMTGAAIPWVRGFQGRGKVIRRYVFAIFILIFWMPFSIFIGSLSLWIANPLPSLVRFEYAGVSVIGVTGEVLACVLWSWTLFLWVRRMNRPVARRILRVALVVTCGVLVVANGMQMVSWALWQLSVFDSVVHFGEVVGSALVLGHAMPVAPHKPIAG